MTTATEQKVIEEHSEAVKQRCCILAQNLIETKWSEIWADMQEQVADGEKFGFGIRFTLPASFPQQVKFKINWSNPKSYDGEITVEDPNQPDLPLGDDEEYPEDDDDIVDTEVEYDSVKALPPARKQLPESAEDEEEDGDE